MGTDGIASLVKLYVELVDEQEEWRKGEYGRRLVVMQLSDDPLRLPLTGV